MNTIGRELNSTDVPDVAKYISYFYFYLINGPLIILSLMANIFFVFCLKTCKTQQVKQPLKILLGSMVSLTMLFLLSLTLLCFEFSQYWPIHVSFIIVDHLIHWNMTTCVWLVFYYFIMIVPSQRALFLWVKKNIKSIIYVMMLFGSGFFLCNALFNIIFVMGYLRYNLATVIAFIAILKIYTLLCLFATMISCFATAHYLNKHMKSLSASGGSLSNPRLHSQIRVTVTGIVQGLLSFLYGMWQIIDWITFYHSEKLYSTFFITITVINLYICGTTVNLGVGQTLFRERAVQVWKAVKKRHCTGKSSKDLRPPGNLVTMTSLSIIECSGVDTAIPL